MSLEGRRDCSVVGLSYMYDVGGEQHCVIISLAGDRLGGLHIIYNDIAILAFTCEGAASMWLGRSRSASKFTAKFSRDGRTTRACACCRVCDSA